MVKILVLPRDENPYQELLYREMRSLGAQVSYLGELTSSHTLNLALLPLETAFQRLFGARIVHVHWVFAFSIPGGERSRAIRRLAQGWFALWLRISRRLGLRLVWTAHNVLPHETVFADDVAARRLLVAASDLVIAHSKSTLASLSALNAHPQHAVVISHGPIAPEVSVETLRPPGAGDGPRCFLFFGRIQPYKGVEDLLSAFALLPNETPARLIVAGNCDDKALCSRLRSLAEAGRAEITLRLERIPEDEVCQLLEQADFVVLPFRQVTTSGSVMAALGHGRPLVLPDLDALAELPEEAVIRYDGSIRGLTAALQRLTEVESKTITSMAVAARRYAQTVSWPQIGRKTMAEMEALSNQARHP